MQSLRREKRTGFYYSADNRYWITKGYVGWNVYELDSYGQYRYSFTCETLKEVRESI